MNSSPRLFFASWTLNPCWRSCCGRVGRGGASDDDGVDDDDVHGVRSCCGPTALWCCCLSFDLRKQHSPGK
jgi:hypothetical protein